MYDASEDPTEEIPVITDEMIAAHKRRSLLEIDFTDTDWRKVNWWKVWAFSLIVPFLIGFIETVNEGHPFSWAVASGLALCVLYIFASFFALFIVLIPGGVKGQVVLAEQDTLRRQRAAYGYIPSEGLSEDEPIIDSGYNYTSWGSPSATKGR